MVRFLVTLLAIAACDTRSIGVPPDAAPYIAKFGEACESDDTCETNLCVDNSIVDIPDNLCTRDCVWGSGCEEGYCVFYEQDVGHCWPSCEVGDPPCREGWVCAAIVGVRLCAPAELVP